MQEDQTKDIPSSRDRTCAFVCFPCRYRRSLHVYEWSYFTRTFSLDSLPAPPVHPCLRCSQPMSCIGKRLQVPPKDDEKAWERLLKQWQAPGYNESMCLDSGIIQENRHFETCRIRLKTSAKGEGQSTGCGRCDAVWERLPV